MGRCRVRVLLFRDGSFAERIKIGKARGKDWGLDERHHIIVERYHYHIIGYL